MRSQPPIGADSVIENVLECYPELRGVFAQRGMYCPICEMARFDTIEDAAREYALPVADLVATLNAAIGAGPGDNNGRPAHGPDLGQRKETA